MRGTPLMLQLSGGLFRAVLSVWNAAVAQATALLQRSSGLRSIMRRISRRSTDRGSSRCPEGQREAAKVLGYTKNQTFFKIIFPQMVKRVLPSVTNEVITLVKDTSLAFALAYAEMFTIAQTDRGGPDDHDAVICGRSVLLYL